MTRRSANRTRELRPLLLLPVAALFIVHPLMAHGCSCGHDFDFHLVNWMEAAAQFSHGTLHPHWAYSPAYNAGEPRFVFYPPLSWVLGALLGLLLTHLPGVAPQAGWNAAPMLFTWTALTLAGFALYRLAREFASPNAALFAAVLYIANPYTLFTAYERTAYAELLAAAWIPLLLLGILREEVNIPGIALPVALLWLTNAPAAVMGSYTLALLAGLRIGSEIYHGQIRPALRTALRTLAGAALGIALAAFYLVPAAYQRRFVQIAMATVEGMRIDRNFLFEHTGTSPDQLLHDQVLHTASTIAVILLIATAATLALIWARRRHNPAQQHSSASEQPPAAFPLPPLAALAASIALMLTPLSATLWKHAPEAEFLQFPWRLLAVLAPVLALSVAAALRLLPARIAASNVAVFLLAAALALPAYHAFRQPCDPEDTAPAQYTLFQSHGGTDPTDEYTPAAADNDALKHGSPPYWLGDSPDATPPAAAQPGSLPSHLTIVAPRAEWAVLNLRYYPNWRIARQGTQDNLSSGQPRRADGLIAIALPAGASTLDIGYRRSPDETAGDAISSLAFAVFLFTLRRERHR